MSLVPFEITVGSAIQAWQSMILFRNTSFRKND